MQSSSSSTRVRTLLLALLAAFCLVAFTQRWLQDDAYITYRYSKNLASGLGAVWNPGYAVEGYTNFSWMLLIAGCIKLGIPAEQATHLLSIPLFVGSLALTFGIARRVLKDDRWALLTMALTGANYSFLMYSTGGLETQLNTTLTLASLLLVVRAVQRRVVTAGSAAGLSVLVALAMMTRPDSIILMLVSFGSMAFVALKFEGVRPATLGRVLLLLLPAALLLVPWLVWKQHFYGGILPNTFYVKLGIHRPGTYLRGLAYVAWPFLSYWWLPILLLLSVKARLRLLPSGPAAFPLIAYTVIWLAYAIRIGGDIMEFRQLICVFPLLILMLVACWREAFPKLESAAVLAVVLVLSSVTHGLFFGSYEKPPGLGNIPVLTSTTLRWSQMGQRLLADLGRNSAVTIAISPAGAIPYWSGLRAIDILGLSDKWVARNGYVRQKCDVCAGHLRLSTFQYLEQAGTNLVLGHPQESDFGAPVPDATSIVERMFYGEQLDYSRIPEDAQLLQIPLSEHESLLALYLQRDPSIDSLIARKVWKAQAIERQAPGWAHNTAQP